ncbi:structural maintenance of chromosomes protein 2-like [Macrosteles quadrilineatus]|uniref:structural maintenance of chromosomes protein 2-like n=1 Tax=Macrosteles quadrilineatus TaxID=74068 RepID=UPI0023E16801|nr:structural maintenance of chromosomes protein 2-like [Macrosteles quadrilineatus]
MDELIKIQEEETSLVVSCAKAKAAAEKAEAEAAVKIAAADERLARVEEEAKRKEIEMKKKLLEDRLSSLSRGSSRVSSRSSRTSISSLPRPLPTKEAVEKWMQTKDQAKADINKNNVFKPCSNVPVNIMKSVQQEVSLPHHEVQSSFQPREENCENPREARTVAFSEGRRIPRDVSCFPRDCQPDKMIFREKMPARILSALPNFSGDLDQWPAWIAEYRRSTEINDYTDLENLQRLQKCITGKAKEIISALLIYPENVPEIVNLLERRFGRPDIIIKNLIASVKGRPPTKDYKPDTLVAFSDMKLENSLREDYDTAQSLVGTGKCCTALSQPVIKWIFGQVSECDQMSTATKITYHNCSREKCITLDRNLAEPGGMLSEDAPKRGGSVFMKILEYTESQKASSQLETEYANIDQKIWTIHKDADKHYSLNQRLEIRQADVEMAKTRIQLFMRVSECKKKEKKFSKKVKQLEAKVKDVKKPRGKELKSAEQENKLLQKKAEESRNKWKEKEQESVTSRSEIEELVKSIENEQQEIEKCVATNEQLNNKELEEQTGQANQAHTDVKTLHKQVMDQKNILSKVNNENTVTQKDKAALEKESEMLRKMIELQHKITKLKSDSGSAKNTLNDFLKAYKWVETDRQFFGQPDGKYDFKTSNLHQVQKQLSILKETRNTDSRGMLSKG